MDPHLWLTFLIGTVIICGSPGPNMLQVMSMSARHGFKHAFFAMAGCFIPVFIFLCVSLAGAGALLLASPAIFAALRYAGAAYLIYLGIGAWRTPIATEAGLDMPPVSGMAPKAIFLRSFLVGISNPKALLFAAAYFPQFLDPHAPQGIQFAVMLATFSVCEISWYMFYALSGSRLTAWLQKARVKRAFNRFTGSLFAVFGLMLALER